MRVNGNRVGVMDGVGVMVGVCVMVGVLVGRMIYGFSFGTTINTGSGVSEGVSVGVSVGAVVARTLLKTGAFCGVNVGVAVKVGVATIAIRLLFAEPRAQRELNQMSRAGGALGRRVDGKCLDSRENLRVLQAGKTMTGEFEVAVDRVGVGDIQYIVGLGVCGKLEGLRRGRARGFGA